MYKRILVPLDGSRRAEGIVAHVEQLAREVGSEVIFLQVLEPTAALVTPYDMVPYFDAEEIERRRDEAKNYLHGIAGDFRGKGISAREVVVQGPIVRSILDVAEREQASLIAMASHGRSGLARVFYGSVAAGVLQQADRPLLIIRAANDE
jgi:nucleotide-binding universal stress UspA family protein